jgi:transcriptional regulator with XRE-family HTH domain
MPPNEIIRTRRELMGITKEEVASYASISLMEYYDIEGYGDEAYTVVPLGVMRSICKRLNLDLLSLFGIEDANHANDEMDISLFKLPRNELILHSRTKLGLSQDDLGDRIGFETVAVEDMERDPDFLERWSIELIQNLANALEIPVYLLLRPSAT